MTIPRCKECGHFLPECEPCRQCCPGAWLAWRACESVTVWLMRRRVARRVGARWGGKQKGGAR